jgi:hypothetical protein
LPLLKIQGEDNFLRIKRKMPGRLGTMAEGVQRGECDDQG